MDQITAQVPTSATEVPDDVLWTRGRRDGGLAHEEDLWRASAAVSPPVWMRDRRPMDQTLRRVTYGGAS